MLWVFILYMIPTTFVFQDKFLELFSIYLITSISLVLGVLQDTNVPYVAIVSKSHLSHIMVALEIYTLP